MTALTTELSNDIVKQPINRAMKEKQLKATIVIDFIHVLEYLWKAAWCLFTKGDQKAEKWVEERALKILKGQSGRVSS